ncbi:sulfatase family protein [Cyclobacterium salsum]|uniref:sulfatase family protein n=1 Tax=Cyclobacterium salsum TaxID=2666329 RepID=UPI0013910461|nr:arylsulfatase [Cyclobacterium salsum]
MMHSRYLILLCFCLAFKAMAQENARPNIVYILADDMGIGDASCYNSDAAFTTPNIDRLASDGLRFTDAHTSSAVCTPTRYGILTGRYNWRSELKNGVLGGFSAPLISSERLTVGDYLQEAGYHTAFVGKWHLGWDWSFKQEYENINNLNQILEVDYTQPIQNGPNDRGFTYSYGISSSLDIPPYVYLENDRVTALPDRRTVNADEKGFWRDGPTGSDFDHTLTLPHLTEKAVSYIDRQARSADPFFLYFALPAPHTPILPLTEFMGKSNSNMYGDFMLQVDDVVGQIIGALEKKGMLENTVIIFTSDNGCSPRADYPELAQVGHDPSNGWRGHKADIYEGGHRVPFLVHWPEKIATGSTSDQLICTTDLMATVAEMLGKPLPENAGEDSFSFLPTLMQGNSDSERASIVHHSIEGRFAIRRGDWKLICWPGSGGWTEPLTRNGLEDLPDFQLYNLATDPGEENNLVDRYPERVEDLKKELIALIKEGRSTAGPKQKNDGPEIWDQVSWAYQ